MRDFTRAAPPPASGRAVTPRRAPARAAFLPLLSAVLVLAGLAPSGTAGAQQRRDLLSGSTSREALAEILIPRERWRPFPTIDDRQAWQAVPDDIRDAFIRRAEAYLGSPWEPIPATVALRFPREGDRGTYDNLNGQRRERLATLVAAEVMENRGRFLDEIANGIWALAEQTYWGSVAHLYMQRDTGGLPDVAEPTVDLFAAEAGALLAWTDYLLGEKLDSVSPLLRARIRHEVDRRVLSPALFRDDFGWMGLGGGTVNNWNPWINSNWLAAALLLEEDPRRRVAAVHKAMTSLDRFFDVYPDDGASDEGPGYWGRAGASAFDNLELLRSATGGKIDLYRDPLVRNMGQYIYRVYIKDEYFVNTGDASAKVRPDAELVYLYGKRIGDPDLQGFGAFLRRQRGEYQPGNSSLGRVLPALFLAREIAEAEPVEPLPGEVWLPDLQLMAARQTPGSHAGLYLSALGGHNDQSHNHNDVGNFIVYADGRPVLIDVGVESYTAKTFGPRRYEIWTMNSEHHNLPTINGVQQGAGRDFEARDVEFSPGGDRVEFSLDIAPAYPAEARVESFHRTLALNRPAERVDLHDAYSLEALVEPVRLNLMTSLRVDVSRPGEIRLLGSGAGESFVIEYDAAKLRAGTQEIAVTDARLRPVWGERVARIVLTALSEDLRDDYRLSIRRVGAAPTD